jgi:acetyl-CoA C-acetyltransferase
VHFAAQAVLSGTADLVVAGGVQSMSQIPISAAMLAGQPYGFEDPFRGSDGWLGRYGDQEISQFRGAQLIAQNWNISRGDLERFALESHRRAVSAIDRGLFSEQIVPVGAARADEGPRRDTSLEKMAALEPLRPGWRITAAVASQLSVGAAALLIASAAAVRAHGLTPISRIHALAVVGSDPVQMLTGPIPATAAVLKRAGLSIRDIDTFEINEAFAPVVLAWARDTGAALERTNVNGGAIALGHPLGATGAILATKAIYELRRTGGRYGRVAMCEGGGQANAAVLERA